MGEREVVILWLPWCMFKLVTLPYVDFATVAVIP